MPACRSRRRSSPARAGFAGSHLLDRLADRAPLVAWHRPGGTPPRTDRPSSGRPWTSLDRAAVAVRIDDVRPARDLSPRRRAARRHVVDERRAAPAGQRPRHASPARSGRTPGIACRVLVVTSAQIYQVGDEPIDEDAPLVPASPYGLSKLAQDQLALRAAREDGLDVVVARPFNHIGPRQEPGFAVASFARQIALDRGRPGAARSSASATSTPAATSPMSATSSTPTSALMDDAPTGPCRTTSAPGARGASAICSRSSCTCRARTGDGSSGSGAAAAQ